jgi:hypothetical protein
MESTQVHLRLSNDIWARYSREAESHGVALGTYLRKRLEQPHQFMEEEVAALRHVIEHAVVTSAPASGTSTLPPGAIVEMLLLLRSLVGPQKAAVAQKEIERRGLETWR